MCIEAVEVDLSFLQFAPDHFKTQEMYNGVVEVDPWQLKDVPDHFKTQKMCDNAARDYLFSLQFVPDWFLTQQQIDVWYDDDYVYNDDKMIKWYKAYCLTSRDGRIGVCQKMKKGRRKNFFLTI